MCIRDRSYLSSWTNSQFTFPGQWGGRLAKNIISNQRIPIAIFNQAVGGKDINYYLPNSDPNSNYSKLQQRLQAAGVSNVAAIVWFQGEGDGWTTPIDTYKGRFRTLHQGWVRDYQPLFTYIFQIRFLSCGHNKPYPFEAQRQLATELPKVGIMSSTNVFHDGCHFPYEGGYQDMADNLFQLFRRDIYGDAISDIEAPNISSANQVSDSEILLTFNNTSRLSVLGSPWNDFRIEGSPATVMNGQAEGNTIRLFLSESTNDIFGVSYLAHSGSATDWIINPNNIGSLTFYNFPIQRTTSTISQEVPTLSTIPLSLPTLPQAEEPAPIVTQAEEPTPMDVVDCSSLKVDIQEDDLFIYGLIGPRITFEVYNEQWELINRCLRNCSEGTKAFQNLQAGRYWVRARILSEDWIELCKVEGFHALQSDSSAISCEDISINAINGGVYVSGLNNAPISSIVIMATDWSRQFYNCWDEACGTADTANIALDNGRYRVNVKYYSESYALLCEKEELIEIGASYQNEISNSRSTTLKDNTLFQVFPSITTNNLNITWNNSNISVTNLQIISLQGVVIRKIPISGIFQRMDLNVGTLPKGIYFLNAPLKDGSNLTRKFIIK